LNALMLMIGEVIALDGIFGFDAEHFSGSLFCSGFELRGFCGFVHGGG
jgi:hypothetical protein